MLENYIDISINLSKDTIIYPGDPIPEIGFRLKLAEGDIANVGQINSGIHHGTHVDVPIHFDEKGIPLDKVPLERFMGKAVVIDFTDLDKCIDAKALESKRDLIGNHKKVLFKTKNSTEYYALGEFFPDFIYIDGSAAQWLVDKGVETVGLDYITVDPYMSPGFPAHNTFLKKGVIIIECIDLKEAEEGEYTLICLPLKIVGSDGAPARAILVKD